MFVDILLLLHVGSLFQRSNGEELELCSVAMCDVIDLCSWHWVFPQFSSKSLRFSLGFSLG